MSLEVEPLSDAERAYLIRTVGIRAARAKLSRAPRPPRLWPLVCAAALFAVSALSFAAAVIIGPPQF